MLLTSAIADIMSVYAGARRLLAAPRWRWYAISLNISALAIILSPIIIENRFAIIMKRIQKLNAALPTALDVSGGKTLPTGSILA